MSFSISEKRNRQHPLNTIRLHSAILVSVTFPESQHRYLDLHEPGGGPPTCLPKMATCDKAEVQEPRMLLFSKWSLPYGGRCNCTFARIEVLYCGFSIVNVSGCAVNCSLLNAMRMCNCAFCYGVRSVESSDGKSVLLESSGSELMLVKSFFFQIIGKFLGIMNTICC